MTTRWKMALAVTALASACMAQAQVTFYEHDGFQGRTFTATQAVEDFARAGFNDRASSVVVLGDPWEVCEHGSFEGQCRVLRPGQYPSLREMGLNDRVSSVRPIARQARVSDERYAPPAQPGYDNRRRKNERLFEADVTSVHAVVGSPGQRCWVEHQPASQGSGDNRTPGAILGAVIGGVLGHQVGGGSGRDLATVGGAVAGAVVGSRVGRGDGEGTAARDVQRCNGEQGANRPGYWDVTYRFRGEDHRIQMTTQPGRTITVNRRGEPRV